MVCPILGSLLRPLFYLLCSIFLIHRVQWYTLSFVVVTYKAATCNGYCGCTSHFED